jgi:hypothetical protein
MVEVFRSLFYKKIFLLLIFFIIVFFGVSVCFGSLLAAWTAPTTEPPEGNIAAPINVGTTGQAKQGGLILNTAGSANGLIVQYGNVGIGTTDPQVKLEVNGNIIAANPIASNHLATKEYVDNAVAAAGVVGALCTLDGLAQTTDWGVNAYGCIGSDKRCINGGCVTCGGWMNAGLCWYFAGASSCTAFCSTHGGIKNNNCDWVNDPTDCSTCRHFYPSAACSTTSNPHSIGPVMISGKCYYHQDDSNYCDAQDDYWHRFCACEF